MNTNLSAYEPVRRLVPLEGRDFALSVRGLDLAAVTGLISNYLPEIEVLVGHYLKNRQTFLEQASYHAFLMTILRDAPDLTAEVISVAADQPEAKAKARTLPAGYQVAVFTEILTLTVEEAGGLKKLLAALAQRVESAIPADLLTALGAQLRAKSLSGSIGGGAETSAT